MADTASTHESLGQQVASATAELGHIDHDTTPASPTTKLGMWLFLGSECLLFGGLISTYLLYEDTAVQRPDARRDVYDIPFTSVSSFVLLMSSLTMVLAVSAARSAATTTALALWLVTTALLGATFVGGQVYEFTAFYREGLGYTTNLLRLGLLHTDRLPRRPRHRRHHHADVAGRDVVARHASTGDRPRSVEIVGLYWHFVDIVWIVIFTVVYLIP